jgi:hypothetical protein
VSGIGDDRLAWASFAALDQVIDELLEDPREVTSEREAYLLRELQRMLVEEKLIGPATDVVVVPARHAWPEYNRFSAYVCQPKRGFQPVKRIAFYSSGQIHPLVPLILEMHESVLFEAGRHKGALGRLVDSMLGDPSLTRKQAGQRYKVMLLTAPDDSRTLRLKKPIANDLVSKGGWVSAFTQNQRYVPLQRLQAATRTSELI